MGMLQVPGYNVFVMSLIRYFFGFLCLSIVWLTAAAGWGAEQSVDLQIAERTRQYQESLRQRAAQLSPSFQAKIESQAQNTVAKRLKQWKKGEIGIQIALPRYSGISFVVRHLPFSGSPIGSVVFGDSVLAVALTVTTVKQVLNSSAIHTILYTSIASIVHPFLHSSESISYFTRIIGTIVQRR
jgi:hypothetical protein